MDRDRQRRTQTDLNRARGRCWPALGVLWLAGALLIIIGCGRTVAPPVPEPPTPDVVASGAPTSAPTRITAPTPEPESTVAAPLPPRPGPTAAAATETPGPTIQSRATSTQRDTVPAPSTPTPAATPPAALAARPSSPDSRSEPRQRDLYELALRLGRTTGAPPARVVNPVPVSYQAGHKDTFFVTDLATDTVHTVEATLILVSENAYWYVDDTLDIPLDSLKEAAEAYERDIYPVVKALVGDVWNPGVDNDKHLTILHTPLMGASAYFDSQDEFPRQVHQNSNEREMIYVDGVRLTPPSASYLGVLAHELQHAVHWNADRGEEAWVNEGMSELVKDMAGLGTTFVDFYLDHPATQLNFWPDGLGLTAPHYGAATLFLAYLAERYGGREGLRLLAQESADGIKGVDAYLSRYDKTFQDVFKDWVVANYLDAPEGPFGYRDRDIRVRGVSRMARFGRRAGELPQMSARYIDLRLDGGDALVAFEGDTDVRQVSTHCHSGLRCWWGNRGDSIDSTLTRELDLSGVDQATLEFWTWYSIEEGWDYGYVEVSVDAGETWTILEGSYTTSDNPIGNNYGHGYTGVSREWKQEKIDLSPYAGQPVLLRFEYITDGAVYRDGFVIDDIAIPQIGFLDDAEGDAGWQTRGFQRIDNVLPQEYLVQVIERRSDGEDVVRQLSLDGDRKGSLVLRGFGAELRNAIIIVSPVTPNTHQRARYEVTVSAAGGE